MAGAILTGLTAGTLTCVFGAFLVEIVTELKEGGLLWWS